MSGRWEDAVPYLELALSIADECSDEEAAAYACVGLMNLNCMQPGERSAEYVAQLAERVLGAAENHGNLYLWTTSLVFHAMDDGMRGDFDTARQKAISLLELCRMEGYSGAIAFGLWMISYEQVISGHFTEAVQYADDGANAAVGLVDRPTCLATEGTAMVLDGQVSSGLELLREFVVRLLTMGLSPR